MKSSLVTFALSTISSSANRNELREVDFSNPIGRGNGAATQLYAIVRKDYLGDDAMNIETV